MNKNSADSSSLPPTNDIKALSAKLKGIAGQLEKPRIPTGAATKPASVEVGVVKTTNNSNGQLMRVLKECYVAVEKLREEEFSSGKASSPKHLLAEMADFLGTLAEWVTDANVHECAAGDTHRAGRLALARAKCAQAATQLATECFWAIGKKEVGTVTLYGEQKKGGGGGEDEEERFQTLLEMLENHEFLVRLDQELDLRSHFSPYIIQQKSSQPATSTQKRHPSPPPGFQTHSSAAEKAVSFITAEHWQHFHSALHEAYAAKRRCILAGMRRRGMLHQLGTPQAVEVHHTLDSLADLMPQYSAQQLHACLRHFGYDVERCTNALMEPREEMPLDLRVLLREPNDELLAAGENGDGGGGVGNGRELEQMNRNYFHDEEGSGGSGFGEEEGEGNDWVGEDAGLIAESVESNEAGRSTNARPVTATFNLEPSSAKPLSKNPTVVQPADPATVQMSEKVAKMKEKYGDLFDLSELLVLEETLEKSAATGGGKKGPLAFKGLTEEEANLVKQRVGDYADEMCEPNGSSAEGSLVESDEEARKDREGRKELEKLRSQNANDLEPGPLNKPLGRKKHAWRASAAANDEEEDEDEEEEEDEKPTKGGGPRGAGQGTTTTSTVRIMEPSFVKGRLPRALQQQQQGSSSHQSQQPQSQKQSGPAAQSGAPQPSARQRQLKEKNKGKARQRGADRKAKGGMF